MRVKGMPRNPGMPFGDVSGGFPYCDGNQSGFDERTDLGSVHVLAFPSSTDS